MSILVSQGLGAGRREEAGRTAMAGMIIMTAFGLPVTGITGVALSNVAGQFAAFWLMAWRLRSRKEISLPWRESRNIPRRAFLAILKVGVPTAGENLSYNFAQIVIVSFIARMGTQALAAYGLAISLSRYVLITGTSIGSAAQIKVGYLVGAGRYDQAYRRVWRYFAFGFCLSVAIVLALNLVKGQVLRAFTGDPVIIAYAAAALSVAMILEPGRNLNTIVLPSLKGSGDTLFPVIIGICFQWGVGVCLAWLFGLKLGLGLAGIWLALSCDEWIRGLIMALRWRSGAWRSKAVAWN